MSDTPYFTLDAQAPPAGELLAAITFAAPGAPDASPAPADPRIIQAQLAPLRGARTEYWYAQGPIGMGRAGPIRYAANSDYLFGVLELNEREHGGIERTTELAYLYIRRFLAEQAQGHPLRIWNHLSAINAGDGDAERYRRFCVGRAAALDGWLDRPYPAATAIGRRSDDALLQIYWLSGRVPGTPLENPRQIPPDRYPRDYGPASPQFSRAMLVADDLLVVSGTASIVGHASHHRGDVVAQLKESLANLHVLLRQAADASSSISPLLGRNSFLKIYLRDPAALGEIEQTLRAGIPPETQYLILAADICRTDLLVEVDCVHA